MMHVCGSGRGLWEREVCQRAPWWMWVVVGLVIGAGSLIVCVLVSNVGRPDGSHPDNGRPGGGRPDGGRPDDGRPDGGRPDGGRPDGSRPIGQPAQGFKDCRTGSRTSGVTKIMLDGGQELSVYCEQQLDGGGWLVFQARKDGSEDFNRDWGAYKAGFGTLTGEFSLGNDNLHQLTHHHDQQLKVELVSPDREVRYADYSRFWIEGEAQKYTLTIGGFSGAKPPGDSMAFHNGHSFKTKDSEENNCANGRKGGWWYRFENNCQRSHLNGLYYGSGSRGLSWYTWKGHYVSMRASRMMIRKSS